MDEKKKKRRKRLLNFLRIFLGLGIILFLFYKIGFREIYQTILESEPLYIFGYIIFLFILFLFGTLNLQILLKPLNKKIPFCRMFKYYLTSWSTGLFIPGRIGEFILIYFLKREKIGLGKAVVIPILDKIITVITLFLTAIFGFFFLFTETQALKLILIFLIVLGMIFFFLHKVGRNIIKKYVLRKHAIKFKGFSRTLEFYLRENRNILLLNFLITFIKTLVTTIAILALFLSFNQTINIFHILIIHSVVAILSLIPISMNGLGIKEASAVFFYGLLGIDSRIVASVYLIMIIITYIIAIITLATINQRKVEKIQQIR